MVMTVEQTHDIAFIAITASAWPNVQCLQLCACGTVTLQVTQQNRIRSRVNILLLHDETRGIIGEELPFLYLLKTEVSVCSQLTFSSCPYANI